MRAPCTPLRRTSIAFVLALSVSLSMCAFASASAAGEPTPPPPVAGGKLAPLPGDDFYNYVNGTWMARTDIPADRSSWGSNQELAEDTNARIVKLIDGVDAKSSKDARRVADYYHAVMDVAGIEARGTAPLKPVLAAIASIKDKRALAQALGASLRADVDPLNATNFFTENLFGLWVTMGLNDPAHNTVYLLQGGLGMPSHSYYLNETARMAALRIKYREHIAATFKLAGIGADAADAEARAVRVFALERALAASHASREDSNDIVKSNNPWRAQDFARKAPGMDWNAFWRGAGLTGQRNFVVWHPGAVTGAAAQVDATDLATWKDYLAFHAINHHANLLPKAFVDQRFDFYGRALSGTPEQGARWKLALAATNAALAEPVGHLYVERYFPAANKERVQQMVATIVAAFSKRIDRLDWMAPATRAQAQAKLKTLYVGVGYPDRWASFDGLAIAPGDAFGNAMRAEAFHTRQQLAKLRQTPDRHEWCMPPQLVNAVNMPLQNAINFPAAKLQAPFYDPAASDAQNYGAIGATIGHEISHSFDDQGAQFDAEGRLRDWWTAQDMAHFKAAAAALAAQYSAYKPYPDLAVNGQQTLSENLADLAGLAAAHDAYLAALAGKTVAPDAEQQFFLGFAQSRRSKSREAAERQQILTDGHAPSQYRTATVRNIDAWYQAFDVQPGQALYLAPNQRVRVW